MPGPTIANAEVDVTLDGRGLPAQARRIANSAGRVLEPELGEVGERAGREFITGMDGQLRQVPANAMRAIRQIDTRSVGRERGADLADSLSDGILSRAGQIGNSVAAVLGSDSFQGEGDRAGDAFSRGLNNRIRSEQIPGVDQLISRMINGFGDGGDRAGTALANRFNDAFGRDVLAGMDRTVALVLRLLGTIGPQLVALTSGISAAAVGIIGSAFTGLAGALALIPGPAIAANIAFRTLSRNWGDMLNTSTQLRGAVDALNAAWEEQSRALTDVAINGIAPLLDALAQAMSGSNFGEAIGRSISAIAVAFTDVVGSPGFSAFLTALETTFPAALTSFGQAVASITQALLTLFAAAGPAAVQLGESFAAWAAQFNTAITQLNDSGGLASFFDQALASISALTGFLGPLARALGNVFIIGSESGNRMLDTLGQLAQEFLAFTQSAEGGTALREWFAGGEQIFNALLPLIGQISQAFADLVTPTVIGQVTSFLGVLGEVVPIVFQVLGVIGELDLLNIVANALLGIGNAITPLLPALSDLASSIGSLDPSVWQALAVGLAGFVVVLRTVGSLVGPISSLFTLLRSGATIGTILRGVVTGLTVGIRALFAALVANPIGAVIALVAALVAGLIYFFTQTETGRAAWSAFVTWLQDLWAGLVEWFTGTFVPAMQGVWDAIVAGVQAVGDFFTAAWEGLLNAPQALMDWFLGTFVPFIQSLPGLVAAGLGAMVGFFISLPGRIIGALASFVAWWLQFWADLFVLGVQLVTIGIDNLVNFFTTLPERVQAGWDVFQAWWAAFWPVFWDTAARLVRNGVQAVIDWFTDLVDQAQTILTVLRDYGPQILRQMWDQAVSAVSNGISRVLDAIGNFVSSFIGFIQGLGRQFYTAMLDSLGEGNRAAIAGVADLLSTVGRIPGQIASALGNLGSTLYSAGADLIQGLINGFLSGAGRLLDEAASLAGQIVNTVESVLQIGSPSRVFERIGQDTVAGLDRGLDPRGVRGAAENLARTTITGFENASPLTGSSYSTTRNNNVAAGAIQIFTQTTDPQVAANMVLDRLVTRLA